MRVYIAGPMTGYPESNYPAFNAAAARWRAAGWEVENPAEHFGGDQTRTYPEYVDADIVVLKTCDAIAMLPGWDGGHSGAIWENAIARHVLGIPVYDAMEVMYLLPFTENILPLTRHPVTGALGRWSNG